jgi:hypothetical protein
MDTWNSQDAERVWEETGDLMTTLATGMPHAPKLLKVLRHHPLAEDALQWTWLRLLERRSPAPVKKLWPFLRRAALNAHQDLLRAERNRERTEREYAAKIHETEDQA